MADKDLMWALKTGDLEEVKSQLVTTEDVNQILNNGRKPLHIVADFGQTELIEFLLSSGAEIDAMDKHGLTPLMYACMEKHVACVKLLLEKGAKKMITMPNGETLLDSVEDADIKALLQ